MFDDSQARLNNLGEPASLPAGHAGLTPDFQGLSAHFIELVSERIVPYKSGEAIFNGEEVSANNANPYGFTRAIDHDQAIVAASGEAFTEILIKDIKPGTYKHARISVAFQRYGITFNVNNIPVVGDLKNQKGTVASFVGYNTHINDLLVHEKVLAVNQAKLQGFWAFETQFDGAFAVYNQLSSGQGISHANGFFTKDRNEIISDTATQSCLDQPT